MATGALANYIGGLGSAANFYNFGTAETKIEAAGAVESRNDATAWVSYGLSALAKGWGDSLPAGSEATVALIDVLMRSLQTLGATIFATVGESITQGLGGIPIIGFIVDMLDLAIGEFVKISKLHSDMAVINSRRALAETRIYWIDKHMDSPRHWLMETHRNMNRPKYRGTAGKVQPVVGKRWNTAPAWRPTRDQSLMFLDDAGRTPTGKCKVFNSYYLDCEVFIGRVTEYDCEKSYRTKDSAEYCVSDVTISALFFPWWSPGYPAGPMQVARAYGNDPWDPNASLIGRQLALLSDPGSNLRARGRELSRMTAKFVAWWGSKENGEVYPVTEKGNVKGYGPDEERPFLVVDEEHDEAWTGLARLYYDRSGLIRSYGGGEDLSRWGLFNRDSLGRGKDGGNLAVTVGQYNTIVAMTLAFYTARANMLRNGYLMRGLVERGEVDELDPDVRDAVREAALVDSTRIPMPGFDLGGFKSTIGRKKFTLGGFKAKLRPRSAMLDAVSRAGDASGSPPAPTWLKASLGVAGAAGLAGAATGGYFLLRKPAKRDR